MATTLDLNLNDDAARLTAEVPLQNNLEVEASWLHHQDEGDVGSLGLHLVDSAAGGGLDVRAGIGARAYYLDPEQSSVDGGAVAVGGFVDYTFPRADRFGIRGYAYYAPDVLASGDVEQYYELGVLLRYEVLRRGDIYIGARILKGEFKGGTDVTFDNGPHFGFRISF